MSKFRRYYIPNAMIFITCVTYQRMRSLEGSQTIQIFWDTLRNTQQLYPFHLLAYAIMPDHFHWVMQMPEEQPNFSIVLHSFKRNFTRNFKNVYSIEQGINFWQSRFWDHIIRDENDLERHIDYIHWNPVKHCLIQDPAQWEHSSLKFWIERGVYSESWGGVNILDDPFLRIEDV